MMENGKRRNILTILIGITAAALLASLVLFTLRFRQEVREENEYREETEKLQQQKPRLTEAAAGNPGGANGKTEPAVTPEEAEAVNYLAELQAVNPDVAAWLTVPGTVIDFPIVQGEDNVYYLTHNLEGERSKLGVPFLDVRCSRDFSDFNSVIYGHHISGGRMFSDLDKFREEEFFTEHGECTLITEKKLYKVRLIACLITPSDSFVYHTVFLSEQEKRVFLRDVSEKALWKRDFEAEALLDKQMLTLSTCAYEYDGARTVVIGFLEE